MVEKCNNLYRRIKGFRYIGALLLTVIVAVQTVMVVCLFFDWKDGYHCDEVYSYGLSNSFYEPYLQGEDVRLEATYRLNEWVSGEDFHRYITVQEGQRFRYDSVWYNQSKDRHPPLFYAVLHTICSFFPDQISFVYGFVINIVCFAVIQIFMYKIGRRLFHSRLSALLLCLFWGFTPAAVGMTVFVRMYSMLTTFMVILLYLHVKLMQEDRSRPLGRLLLPIYGVTLAGAMTQYLFLFGAFVLTVGFCLRYLVQKRWKHFLAYGFTVLSGVLTSFLCYPAAIRQLFLETSQHDTVSFGSQMTAAFRLVLYQLLGIGFSDVVWWLTVLPVILVVLILFCIPLLFLLRDRPRVRQGLAAMKALPGRWKKGFSVRKIGGRLRRVSPLPFLLLLVVLTIVTLMAFTVSFKMAYMERYIYVIFPILSVLLVWLAVVCFRRLKSGKIWTTLVCLLLTVSVISVYDVPTVMHYDNTFSLREALQGKNVLVMANHSGHYIQLSAYAYELSKANVVFFTSAEDYEEHIEDIRQQYAGENFAIVFFNPVQKEDGAYCLSGLLADDGGVRTAISCDDIIHNIAGDAQREYIGTYGIFTANMLLCEMHGT